MVTSPLKSSTVGHYIGFSVAVTAVSTTSESKFRSAPQKVCTRYCGIILSTTLPGRLLVIRGPILYQVYQ